MLCWARHFTLTVPLDLHLSVYMDIINLIMLRAAITLLWTSTSHASRRRRNTLKSPSGRNQDTFCNLCDTLPKLQTIFFSINDALHLFLKKNIMLALNKCQAQISSLASLLPEGCHTYKGSHLLKIFMTKLNSTPHSHSMFSLGIRTLNLEGVMMV